MIGLDPIQALAVELDRARRVLVITGAGMSADSGLPTYRGVGGLYDSGPTEDGVAIEDALSGSMLRRDPRLCWKYLQEIERATRGRKPNGGHEALVTLAPRYEQFTVLTQNVDGFHRRAGQDDLIEIHGNLQELHCTGCTYQTRVEDYEGLSLPPQCPACGGLVRPRVVLFGESLPAAQVARLQSVLTRGVDLVISIGTTSVFPYIAQPVLLAARSSVATVEINPGDTEVSDRVRYRIRDRAEPVLQSVVRMLRSRDPMREVLK